MKRIIVFVFLLLASVSMSAQQEPATIRVKRESSLVKAVFDNTQLKLMAVDRFGNPRENRIVSYKLYVKAKRETKEFSGFSNDLTDEMIKYLEKQKSAVKIFFTEVTVRDENEHLLRLPDVIDTWFPQCGNCDSKDGRKRRGTQ